MSAKTWNEAAVGTPRSVVRLSKNLILRTPAKAGYGLIRLPRPGDAPEGSAPPAQAAPGGHKDPALRPWRINMHHVGGRGGGFAFPFPHDNRFAAAFETYLYDADPDCGEMDRCDHAIVAAVTGRDGAAEFFVNGDPSTSSLLPNNPAAGHIFYNGGPCDYVIGDALAPAKTLRIEGKTLATLSAQHGFPIDYLSLDVQGAEYDLISGMTEDTIANTVAIMAEISHVQFYKDQKTFGGLADMLRERGFFLAEMYPHGSHFQRFMTPLGWRAKGFNMHGDALFLRDPGTLNGTTAGGALSLYKEAFVSLCYGYLSNTIECLSRISADGPDMPYVKFLDEVMRLYRRADAIYPVRFSRTLSRRETELLSGQIATLTSDSRTDIEALLHENGFGGLAAVVKSDRIRMARGSLETLAGHARSSTIREEAISPLDTRN